MEKYFYMDGTTKMGPVTFEVLKDRNIKRDTLVWFNELTDWKQASEVPELNELFLHTPPPSPSSNMEIPTPVVEAPKKESTRPLGPPPKTWLVESILVTLFCCMPFGIAGIVFASKVESSWYAGNREAAEKASRDAAKWTKIGFWASLVGIGLYVIIIMIMGGFAAFM